MLPHKGIYILIAVGAVMMFVGFLGCYGAIQESQCLLGTVRSGARRGQEGGAEAEPRVLEVPCVLLRWAPLLGRVALERGLPRWPRDLAWNDSPLGSLCGSETPPCPVTVTSGS